MGVFLYKRDATQVNDSDDVERVVIIEFDVYPNRFSFSSSTRLRWSYHIGCCRNTRTKNRVQGSSKTTRTKSHLKYKVAGGIFASSSVEPIWVETAKWWKSKGEDMSMARMIMDVGHESTGALRSTSFLRCCPRALPFRKSLCKNDASQSQLMIRRWQLSILPFDFYQH